jgi:DNA-binding response OmpR family regulator
VQKESLKLEDFLLAQTPIKAALTEIWLSLTPAEQSDIMNNTFDDPVVDQYLEDSGLVRAREIQIPLFANFVKSSKSQRTGEEEKIVYDENTNSIRKGNAVLSDSLTSAEFRLMRYLLQNQERVIERDALIAIVWAGAKSTAGITDQAVDQLIFRLRRKIEEDPNKPVYLQTVKGRGFKFAG